jgi:hypothetical protein
MMRAFSRFETIRSASPLHDLSTTGSAYGTVCQLQPLGMKSEVPISVDIIAGICPATRRAWLVGEGRYAGP